MKRVVGKMLIAAALLASGAMALSLEVEAPLKGKGANRNGKQSPPPYDELILPYQKHSDSKVAKSLEILRDYEPIQKSINAVLDKLAEADECDAEEKRVMMEMDEVMSVIEEFKDLVLTYKQAHDALDGNVPPLLLPTVEQRLEMHTHISHQILELFLASYHPRVLVLLKSFAYKSFAFLVEHLNIPALFCGLTFSALWVGIRDQNLTLYQTAALINVILLLMVDCMLKGRARLADRLIKRLKELKCPKRLGYLPVALCSLFELFCSSMVFQSVLATVLAYEIAPVHTISRKLINVCSAPTGSTETVSGYRGEEVIPSTCEMHLHVSTDFIKGVNVVLRLLVIQMVWILFNVLRHHVKRRAAENSLQNQ